MRKKCKNGAFPMSQWLSKQHFESIPKHIRKSHACFSSFLTAMSNGREQLQAACRVLMENKSREQSVKKFHSFLKQWAGNSSKGNLMFMAHQVISDLENLFGLLFGSVVSSSVVGGHAGTLGHTMVNWQLEKEDKRSFAETLDDIVEYMNEEGNFTDEILFVGGYQRQDDGRVENVVNGLLFSAVDAEHFLCKAWIHVKKTFNHYRNSSRPIPLMPHSHPVRWPTHFQCNDITNNAHITTIMNKVVDYYLAVTSNTVGRLELKLVLPELFVVG